MTRLFSISAAGKRLLPALLLSFFLSCSAFGIAAETPATPPSSASTSTTPVAAGQENAQSNTPSPSNAAAPSANRFDSPLIFLVLLAAAPARAMFGMAGSIGIALLAATLTWFAFASVIATLAMGAFAFLISLIRFSPGSGSRKNPPSDGTQSSGDVRTGKW